MLSKLEIKDKTDPTDGIKIAPFRKNIRNTSPHKHNNYFEVVYLIKGSGSHTIDTKRYDILTPIVFTIRREQIHFWNIDSEPEGYVLIIKKSFIDNCLDRDIKVLISELSSQTCLFPDDDAIVEIFNILAREYQSKTAKQQPIIEGLLKALLAKLLESTKPDFSLNVNNNLFQQFIELLNQEEKLINSVAQYADDLNTTPQNLNAICRKEVQQSATEILSERIINEAKRLLLYTDLNINEISLKLNFKDNSHFTKYFKRHTQTSPNQFRKQAF